MGADNRPQVGKTLAGKACVITGGTKGIGEATAKLFAELGASVLITGRDESRGKRLENSSKQITFKRVDLEDRDDVTRFLAWLDARDLRPDVMISNASRNSRYSVTNISVEEWDRMLQLNLTAPFLLSRWAAKKMIESKVKGKIIILGAIQALFPLERSFAYVTTKGGLISMVRSLAVDLGGHGIQVTGVLPGQTYVDGEEVPSSIDTSAATLLGRMGRPEEISHLLAFLASDQNSFMTGNIIIIDGGRVISRKPDPDYIRTIQ
jgi:NAD(P)-dependent dehydrogenase (short-subunit alcohol dehydrogenase family)